MAQSPQGFGVGDREASSRPSNELELYDRAIRSTVEDDILEEANFGLGNYSDAWYWQQVQSFRHWLFADSAFANRLLGRAIEETKTALAKEAWQTKTREEREAEWEQQLRKHWDNPYGDEDHSFDRRRWIQAKKDHVWENMAPDDPGLDPTERRQLTVEARLDAIEKHAGVSAEWSPPHGRMVKMRHEASRSIGARLIDNLFGRKQVRVEEHRTDGASSNGLRGRFSNNHDNEH